MSNVFAIHVIKTYHSPGLAGIGLRTRHLRDEMRYMTPCFIQLRTAIENDAFRIEVGLLLHVLSVFAIHVKEMLRDVMSTCAGKDMTCKRT